jgi:hypothetical protein
MLGRPDWSLLDVFQPPFDDSCLISFHKYYVPLSSDFDHQITVVAKPVCGEEEMMVDVFVHCVGFGRTDPTATVQKN